MRQITDRQREVLIFIAEFTEENVYPPTVREISDHFKISLRAVQDHIAALQDILDYKNVPIHDYKSINKEVNIEKFNFRIINFPGHKEDLVGFLFDNKLFSGDFIFEGTIGRTDLPGGNYKEMQESIKKILSFKNDLQIYPGHGQSTNLSKERKNLNSYL